jgi:hypothetical protein
MAERIASIISENSKEILTPNEAGVLYGISGWAMYKRAKKGTAPAHYIGRKLYFLRSELIDAVQQR